MTKVPEVETEDTEIRKLKHFVIYELGKILNVNDDWKTLMSIVTVDCDLSKPLKYNIDDVNLIETAGKEKYPHKGCTAIFLTEWGTSGRIRPKVKNLIEFLNRAKLYRASYFINKEVLKKPVDEEFDEFEEDEVQWIKERTAGGEHRNGEARQNEDRLIVFKYSELERATDGFNDKPYREGGNRLGSGAFGAVYYGTLTSGQEIAVKHLENHTSRTMCTANDTTARMLFENEIVSLSQCKHENLVVLLGFSFQKCIVYEYMHNGSLYDRLACLYNTLPISSSLRLEIALGVAKALHYLHCGLDRPFIHRDVKSENILLSDTFIPKLADFGIVKIFNRSDKTSIHTDNNAGTSPYMPHEALQGGEISTKTDVFSYGVVILELLTGLKPYMDDKKTTLYFYFLVEKEMCLEDALDINAGHWDSGDVQTLIDLATNKCCTYEKAGRATMQEIENILTNLINNKKKDGQQELSFSGPVEDAGSSLHHLKRTH